MGGLRQRGAERPRQGGEPQERAQEQDVPESRLQTVEIISPLNVVLTCIKEFIKHIKYHNSLLLLPLHTVLATPPFGNHLAAVPEHVEGEAEEHAQGAPELRDEGEAGVHPVLRLCPHLTEG